MSATPISDAYPQPQDRYSSYRNIPEYNLPMVQKFDSVPELYHGPYRPTYGPEDINLQELYARPIDNIVYGNRLPETHARNAILPMIQDPKFSSMRMIGPISTHIPYSHKSNSAQRSFLARTPIGKIFGLLSDAYNSTIYAKASALLVILMLIMIWNVILTGDYSATGASTLDAYIFGTVAILLTPIWFRIIRSILTPARNSRYVHPYSTP